MIEQPLLPPEPSAVTAKRTIGADHAMAGNDDAHHVRAVRAADGAARSGAAELLGHPGIGARLREWNRAQHLPGAHLEVGADGRERDSKIEIFAGKIIAQFFANPVEITMFARDDASAKALSQDPDLAFECAAFGEFEQAQAFVIRDRDHRA
ncbi:MAG TPA: hypothetical protein VGF73_09620 [Chthoniobacterales bacterium]